MNNNDLTWLIEKPIAHRGLFNDLYPENSLGAFNNAVKYNYGIELDVQFTKDKEVIVFHDDNLKRMTGLDKNVNELEYKEIKKLKLLNTNENTPLLEEVLKLVNGDTPLIIEIKNCNNIKELGEYTYNILRTYKGEFAVESFNPIVLKWYKINAPYVVRGQLSGNYKKFEGKSTAIERFILTNMLLNFLSKPNFIAYELNSLPNTRISSLRKKGMIVIAWTIKNEKDEEKAYKYSDNIIFDSFRPKIKNILKKNENNNIK